MKLKISRILHAGYVFEHAGAQIAFDPIFENPFSQNCYAYPDVRFDREQIKQLQFDAVFISHFHDDHLSLESLSLLKRETQIYLYCTFERLFDSIRELGFVNVHSLKLNQPVQIKEIEVIPRRALDVDVDSMFQVRAAGLNILNVVDSWIDPETLSELARMKPWDMVLWPFQTMREIEVLMPSRAKPASTELPSEWAEQLKALNPKYIVPSSCQFVQESWSWYNQAFFPISYRQFEKQVTNILPDVKVVRLNPSVSITLSQDSLENSAPLPWIEPIGEQNVDYHYDPNLKAPPTSEIAKKFAALDSQQTARVRGYCRSELIEKYNSLDSPMEIYFEKPRLWQLSLYDHKGEVSSFFYRVQGAHLEHAKEGEGEIAWLTEIPIFKLHSALETGEPLTSLYVRINDWVFSPEIEKEIADVDVIEDPLIRSLFT